jgi:hypothetical protein
MPKREWRKWDSGVSPEEARRAMRRWIEEPLTWARQVMPEGFDPWSGQVALWGAYGELLRAKLKRLQGAVLTEAEQAVVDRMGISVMAGQGLGKERSVVGIALHYLWCLQAYEPKVVCTAPAGSTLTSTLWPEFGKVIKGSSVLSQWFEKQADRIFLKNDEQRGGHVWIRPRTIQKYGDREEQAVVLGGIHATGVLYIATEASEVPEAVFDPLQGGLTDPLSMIILIFNPTRTTGFAAESQAKARKYWTCLQWSGRQLKAEKAAAPGRFAWYNERAQDILIEKYGDDSDFVRVRVDGLPPRQSTDVLIPYEAVSQARTREVTITEMDPVCVFVDVGGEGEDPTVLTVVRGNMVVRQEMWRESSSVRLGEMIAGRVSEWLAQLPREVEYAVGVDANGIGWGVYCHLRDVQRVRALYPIMTTETPRNPERYHRLRDQMWWELREAFVEQGTISLLSLQGDRYDELCGELTSVRWAEVAGKIKIQGKGHWSSGIPGVDPLGFSPNHADSLCGAWYLRTHCLPRVPLAERRQRRWRRRMVSFKAI